MSGKVGCRGEQARLGCRGLHARVGCRGEQAKKKKKKMARVCYVRP